MSDAPQTIERLVDLERALDHPDDRVRLQVAQLIAKHPEQARGLRSGKRDVVDVLIERIERESRSSFRVAALTALTSLGNDPRTIAVMIREVQTAHGTFEHMLSLYYLAEHDAEHARPFARRLLFSDQRDQVRIATHLLSDEADITPQERIRMLCTVPGRSNRAWTPAHLAALVKELTGPFSAGAQEIVLEHHPELLAPLLEHWGELDLETQTWLTRNAIRFPDSLSAQRLVRHALQAETAELRLTALRHMVAHGTDTFGIAPHELQPLLAYGEEHAALVMRLAATGDELHAVAADGKQTPNLRSAAIAALARSGANEVPAESVRMWLHDPAWKVRSATADLLAHRDDLSDWVSVHWRELDERAQLAVARAALEQHRDDVLEATLGELALV
jgi:hypothetical protein